MRSAGAGDAGSLKLWFHVWGMGTQCPGKLGPSTWGAGTWGADTGTRWWHAWDPEVPGLGVQAERHNMYGLSILWSLLGAGSEVGRHSLKGWQVSSSLRGCWVVSGARLDVGVAELLASVAPPFKMA